jgi:CubicO group peptidase (beta-lactamase class C family)
VDETDPITGILREGIRTRVFPGAVLFVRHKGQIRVHQAIGLTSSHPDSAPVQINTIYDLASLTKPLATASSILLLVQEGRLSLTQTLATLLEETEGFPCGQASLKDLLSHQSGLPAWRPFYQSFSPTFSSELDFRQKRIQVVLEMILKEPIDQSSSTTSKYSDLGYMVLGFVVERVTGQSLADFTRDRIFNLVEASPLAFGQAHLLLACTILRGMY